MSNNAKYIALTGTSPAAASTVAGAATTDNLAGYQSLRVEAFLVGATGGALDVYLQASYDGGQTWSDYIHYAQLAAGAAAVKYGSSHSRSVGDALGAVFKDLTPGLTVNTKRDGCWGMSLRVLCVAGASTSAGAAYTIKLFLSA